jgi:hypothetical protein
MASRKDVGWIERSATHRERRRDAAMPRSQVQERHGEDGHAMAIDRRCRCAVHGRAGRAGRLSRRLQVRAAMVPVDLRRRFTMRRAMLEGVGRLHRAMPYGRRLAKGETPDALNGPAVTVRCHRNSDPRGDIAPPSAPACNRCSLFESCQREVPKSRSLQWAGRVPSAGVRTSSMRLERPSAQSAGRAWRNS